MQGTKQYIIFLAFIFLPILVQAQNNCTQNLREARNIYEEGRLNQLPDLLISCIRNGFSKEEKVEALRLVTLSYLFEEEIEEAEKYYLQLLRLNPEYEVNEDSDPTELVILAERFDTAPKFYFGIKLGSAFNIIESNPVFTVNNLQEGSYGVPLSFGGGLFFRYPFNNEMSANAEVYYNFRNVVLTRPTVQPNNEPGSEQEVRNAQQSIDMPILFNYKLPFVKKFLLEATGGPVLHYLISSNLSVEGVNRSFNNLDMLPYRNQFNFSGTAGVRASFKRLGLNFITVEALFQYKILDEISTQLPTDLSINLANAGYAEDSFKSHGIWLRVGVKFPYYKPELVE